MERRRSKTFTTQGEVDCAYHVCSKLMIRNMVEFVMPLPLSDQYEEENCNQFLNTRTVQLEGLTEEKCTPNGFLKIILFHYFYTLYVLHLDPSYSSFGTSKIDVIQRDLVLPTIPTSHKNEINYVMRRVNHVKETLRIEWRKIAVFTKENMFSFIQKVTRLGFYVALNLEDKTKKDGHTNHSVVVVGTYYHTLLIKNSWGDEQLHEMKIDETLVLGEYHFTIVSCVFYLPCRDLPIHTVHTSESMALFSTWLDNYISEFPELIDPIPALASTPEPTPEPKPSKRTRPTFAVGDVVKIEGESIPLTISEIIKPDEYNVTYLNGEEIETRRVFGFQLTKGGSRRRTRKRIR